MADDNVTPIRPPNARQAGSARDARDALESAAEHVRYAHGIAASMHELAAHESGGLIAQLGQDSLCATLSALLYILEQADSAVSDAQRATEAAQG
jgi:hypothetical protein